MGFRSGAFATVWEASPISNTHTKLKISISYKNEKTGSYEQDFSGFVSVFGTSAAAAAAQLTEKSRIKLGNCDVSTSYDKERKIGYTNFKVFSFEILNQDTNGQYGAPSNGGNNYGGNSGGTYGGNYGGNYGGGQQSNYAPSSPPPQNSAAVQEMDAQLVSDGQGRLPF